MKKDGHHKAKAHMEKSRKHAERAEHHAHQAHIALGSKIDKAASTKEKPRKAKM